MPYTIEEHNHRLAAWAASTSASASSLCRFKVETGIAVLEQSGFTALGFATSNSLPAPAELDATHAAWRETVINSAHELGLTFTHGVAAKLINCYLKVRLVCAGHHLDERVQALHPPIDALLLGSLARLNYGSRRECWHGFHQQRWSKFDSATYQAVIDLIRQTLPHGAPLWKIEEFWEGHQ
jgi:hypothetical protein